MRGFHALMDVAVHVRSPWISKVPHHSERGSGTVLGVMLVLLTITLLAAVAGASNVLVVRSQVRSLGDLGALSAARALYVPGSPSGSGDAGNEHACLVASQVAGANDLTLGACEVRGPDVVVEMIAETSIPLIPEVRSTSVAGPRECSRG